MTRKEMHVTRGLFTNGQSASNKMPRQINRNLIFNQIRTRQPISRAELSRVSGLQRSTISLIVEELLKEQWIVEGSLGRIPRGRRPTFLNLNSQRGVLAIDVHPSHATLAVTDMGGTVLSHTLILLPENPQKVIPAIVNGIQKMLANHKEHAFDGIGMSLPGRFDLRAEKTIFAPNVDWPIGRIKSRVEQATGLPVVVDNVANACALSEVWFGYSNVAHDLVVVNVSEGIGTGIFANGHILRGEGGFAGECGHMQIIQDGLPCGCGGRGCWETVASNRAGMRYYKEITGSAVGSFEALIKLAEEGDDAALQAIHKMCVALGQGMHMIAAALAPNEIVVVGDITNLWNHVEPIIETEMRQHPLAYMPKLRPAYEGSRARLRSAVALVMNENSL